MASQSKLDNNASAAKGDHRQKNGQMTPYELAHQVGIAERARVFALQFYDDIMPYIQRLLASLEKDIKKGPNHLLDLLFNEFYKIMEGLEIAKISGKPADVYVGLLGCSGSGKSSLLNAIIGKPFLPISDDSACTSVPIVIAYNNDDDKSKKYKMEVEFINPNELSDMLSTVTVDAEDLDPLSEKERESAIEILSTLFGVSSTRGLKHADIQTLVNSSSMEDHLGNISGVADHLGKVEGFFDSDVKSFAQRLQTYVRSNEQYKRAKKAQWWPLVREVRVYVKSTVLMNGLVFIDLPGNLDSNIIRSSCAARYARALNVSWVFADIVRAISDDEAMKLLQSTFTGSLNTGAAFTSTDFILTKIDVINPENYLNHPSVRKAHETKVTIAEDLKRVKKKTTKTLKAIEEQKAKLSRLKVDIRGLQGEISCLRAAPATEINNEAKRKSPDSLDETLRGKREEKANLKFALDACEKRANELKEKERQLALTKEQARKEEYYSAVKLRNELAETSITKAMRGNEERYQRTAKLLRKSRGIMGNSENADLVTRKAGVVIPCSSLQWFKRKQDDSDSPHHCDFPDDNSTGLPQLKRHAMEQTLDERFKSANRCISGVRYHMNTMYFSLLDNNNKELSKDLKKKMGEDLSQARSDLHRALLAVSHDECNWRINQVNLILNYFVDKAEAGSQDSCNKLLNRWERTAKPQSYRTVAKRQGKHIGAGYSLDWNSEISGTLYGFGKDAADYFFRDVVPQTSHNLLSGAKEQFFAYDRKVREIATVYEIGLVSLGKIDDEIKDYINQLREHINSWNKKLSGIRNNIEIAFRRLVLEQMLPAYLLSANEKGRGCCNRIKELIGNQLRNSMPIMIQQRKSLVYKMMVEDVLEPMIAEIDRVLEEMIDNLANNYQKAFGLSSEWSKLSPEIQTLKTKMSKIVQNYRRFLSDSAQEISEQEKIASDDYIDGVVQTLDTISEAGDQEIEEFTDEYDSDLEMGEYEQYHVKEEPVD